MADSYADEVIRRHDSMKSERGVWESHWEQVARVVLPRMIGFQSERTAGEKRSEYQFDSTASLALDRFAAAEESMLTPRTQRWHTLETGIPELDKDIENQRWYETLTAILFRARYAPTANFASQAHENYVSLGAFGTGAIFTDEVPGLTLRYRSIHLAELFLAEDHVGRIDTVLRKFKLTARQAMQKWPGRCPDQIVKAAEGKNPDQQFEFIHMVCPNGERKHGRADYRGMAVSSCYVSIEGRKLLDEGGYRTMPYAVSRYVTAMREVYGRSPAMTVLADIKTLNEQEKTLLRAAHMAVDPPMLASDDGALQPFALRPGAVNRGYLSHGGERLIEPLQSAARIDIGLEMQDQKRKSINDAFLVTLFQILVDTPSMTATEAMLRAQEKGALLAPTMGRQQSEMLGPLIDREMDLLDANGVFPPPPAGILDYIRSGGQILPKYTSPLSRIQQSEDAVGILKTLEQLTPLAQIDPTALRRINVDEAAKVLAELNGAPARILRTDEELAAMDEKQQSADAAAQMLAAAPIAAGAAKDIAQTEQIMSSVPRRGPPAMPGVA